MRPKLLASSATGMFSTGARPKIFMAVVAPVTFAPAASANEPNVIVIMTDDQGNNVGFQGNPHVTTPHIDRLASTRSLPLYTG